jgi:two-component system, sensor histidine kinase
VIDLGVPPAPRPSQTRLWLWAIVAILLAAFATVAGLQWRQSALLNASVRFESDNIVWTFFQLEVEYLKLRDTLRAIDRDPARLDRDALQTRYDIFVSRVALVEPRLTMAAMAAKPIQTETVARVQSFVAAADVFLGSDAARPIDIEAARSMLARLEPLGESVHDMSMWANDAMDV